MHRKVYMADELISLSEYISSEDDLDCYNCWQDEETQSSYNHKLTEVDAWSKNTPKTSRFIATVLRLSDHTSIGTVFLSPENTPPDLAIMIYPPYRKNGFGVRAFALGMKYCFEVLGFDKLYAGCYPHNVSSLKMLQRCGFEPHPDGDQMEKHYVTGEDITQLDFVKHNPNKHKK